MRLPRFALATALATFGLLLAGNLVSTTESGLACPDWPLCEGQFIPPMVDGKQFEHTHRLIASFVGAMTFGLCALLFKYRRKDRVLTRLGVAAAFLVTVQALLGALTVKLKLPVWVSSTHLGTAMAFFCLAVSLAILTRQRVAGSDWSPGASRKSARWILPVTVLAYGQVVLGGVMRHSRGGLVCGYEFPRCLGKWWPWDSHLGVQVHLAHRAGGVLLLLGVLALAFVLLRDERASGAVKALSASLAVGVLAQAGLGIATIMSSREQVTMTTHSGLGAALLAGLVCLYWLARPSRAPTVVPAPSTASAHASASLGVA